MTDLRRNRSILCVHCGHRFVPRYPSQRYCYPSCYRKRERALAEYDSLRDQVRALERALIAEQLRAVTPARDLPDDRTLRWMIQKLHPDKHNGCESAQRAAKLLNAWRNRTR